MYFLKALTYERFCPANNLMLKKFKYECFKEEFHDHKGKTNNL